MISNALGRACLRSFLIYLTITLLAGLALGQVEDQSDIKALFEQQRNLATRLWERGDFRATVKALERALELEPEWLVGWRQLAIAQKALGERAKAIKTLEHALELNPA